MSGIRSRNGSCHSCDRHIGRLNYRGLSAASLSINCSSGNSGCRALRRGILRAGLYELSLVTRPTSSGRLGTLCGFCIVASRWRGLFMFHDIWRIKVSLFFSLTTCVESKLWLDSFCIKKTDIVRTLRMCVKYISKLKNIISSKMASVSTTINLTVRALKESYL